jgi:hypothetical protein
MSFLRDHGISERNLAPFHQFIIHMSGEVPLRMGHRSCPSPVSRVMEAYLNAQREELADREDMVAGIRVDDDFLDGDELFIVENSIFEVFL